jgi:Copper amine oxidase N-terminal domain
MLVATAVTASVASLAVALSTPASISVDGQRVASDVGPVTTTAGAYLPLRALSEAAGAEALFDAKTGAITVRRGTDTLTMHVGSTKAVRNGRTFKLVHAPFTVRGRTMVAAATIERTFGSTVRFDAKHDRVEVRTPGVVVAPVGDEEP